MHFKFVMLLVSAFYGLAFAAFPNDIMRCKLEDDVCMQEVFNGVVEKYYEGNRALHLAPLDPLKIKTLIIAQNAQSPVNIQLKFTDVALIGFKNARLYKCSLRETENKVTLEGNVKIPQLDLVGPYEIKGNVLVLPIVGKGHSNMTLENVNAKIKFEGPIQERNGEGYLHINKLKLTFEINRFRCYLENLFNGDKALGEETNKFLNENWKEIFAEIQPAIEDAIGEVLHIVIQGVFAGAPLKKMFLN